MMNEKKYMVARWIGNPYQSDDRTHSGPFTFAEAMHAIDEYSHTGDTQALCDLDCNIIPEYEWPKDELNSYAHHALIELEKGRANR